MHEEDFLTHLVPLKKSNAFTVFFHSVATGNIFKSKIISRGGKPTLFTKISYERWHFNSAPVIIACPVSSKVTIIAAVCSA
jgi:hypothetical protein